MAGFGNINRDVDVNNKPAGGGGTVTILPDDIYELEIMEGDVQASGTGKGQNYSNKVQVVSGEHKGVWFFSGINNIQHQSAQAQQIAQGTLKALCLSTGVDFSTLADTDELNYRPFFARVGSETYYSRKHQKDMTKNVISKYMYDGMPEDEADAAAAPPAEKREPTPPPPAERTPPAAGRRPWERK